MKTYCKNTRCRYCFIDTGDHGQLVCDADGASLMKVPDSRVFILKCNTYLKRPEGTSLRPMCQSLGSDGLYPGQLRPPVDMSDFDAEDMTGPTLDGLDSLKDCKT